jgi:AP-1 complex subunit gamma-1
MALYFLFFYSYIARVDQEDLIDSEVPAAGPAPNGQAATNENLIDELSGSSSSPSLSTVASPTRTQKSTVDDIMGLFDSSAPVIILSLTQALPSNASSAFSSPQTQCKRARQTTLKSKEGLENAIASLSIEETAALQ